MPLVRVTNVSKNPRGFHEEGATAATLIEVGEARDLTVDDGLLEHLQKCQEAGELQLEIREGAAPALDRGAVTADDLTAERERQEAAFQDTLRADEDEERAAAAGQTGQALTINPEDLDDDQLRALIEKKTGKPPHAQLGRPKLLIAAAEALKE